MTLSDKGRKCNCAYHLEKDNVHLYDCPYNKRFKKSKQEAPTKQEEDITKITAMGYATSYSLINFDGKTRCGWCKKIVDKWTKKEIKLHIEAHDWSDKENKALLRSKDQEADRRVEEAVKRIEKKGLHIGSRYLKISVPDWRELKKQLSSK